jgi:hypothetical protein
MPVHPVLSAPKKPGGEREDHGKLMDGGSHIFYINGPTD